MIPGILLLVAAGLALYLTYSLIRHGRSARRKEELRSERLGQYLAARGSGSAGARPNPISRSKASPEGLEAAAEVSTREFQDEGGRWVEMTERSGQFPGGSFSVVSSKTTHLPRGSLLDELMGSGGARLQVVPPDELPTFSDVGGMESLKQEVRETLGLILRHGEGAQAYGITWNGVLLHGPPGVGKTFLARAVAGEYRLKLLHVSTGDLVEGIVGQSARNVQQAFAVAAQNLPCLLFFDEFDSIAQRRDSGANAEERRTVNQLLTSLEASRGNHGLLVMAATNDLDHLDRAIIRPGRFDRHVRIDLPDAAARRSVLAAQLRSRPACGSIDLDEIAGRTAGMTPAALARIVDVAALRAFKAAATRGVEVEISMEHMLSAVEAHGGEDRPMVEDWDWDHLVLPPAIKAELQQLQALLEDPQLADRYGVDPPSGILLAGPPGTGKTTVARVLAAQARCSFYPVSAADVLSKWVGESEGNIRQLFERARTNRPSIIFIDELDAIGGHRGSGRDGSDRQLNQLLVEIDGMDSSAGILVIGATNRPELLDPALLRGGRLSRTIRLDPPTRDVREEILRMNTARMPTVDVDLEQLAAATEGLSGADLKALCQQAAVNALMRARHETDGDQAAAHSAAVLSDDFERALADTR